MPFVPHPWMVQALDAAQHAYDIGEVPVGALIIHDGAILTTAYNQIETTHDATAHAEMLAIRSACEILGTRYLTNCELVVTLEPCAMCAQAIALARIGKLTFGAYDPKGGAVEYGVRLFQQPTCHHHPEVVGGVMERECSALLKRFFQQKR